MMTSLTASATLNFPKIKDRYTGKIKSIRVLIRRMSFSYMVGSFRQQVRVTLTVRGGSPRYSVETLAAPIRSAPWSVQEEPAWRPLFPAALSHADFVAFLTAQRLDAARLVWAIQNASPEHTISAD